ncbi:MAG: response regulator [Candidatus Electrothrix communis]|nr:MAG: response regulator [Candidatus Electrothrix communis]
MEKKGGMLGVLGLDRVGVGKKLIFLVYILVIFSMTTVAYYGYQHAGAAYRDKALSVASLGVRDTGRSISDFLRTIPDDLSFVSSFYAMKRYLYWQDLDVEYKSSEWKHATVETFRSFLLSKDYYCKLRFIDAKGHEQIVLRHNKENGSVFTEPTDTLQDKVDKDYFFESIKLSPEDFYVSEINLNEEQGKVEKPYVPVIRFARLVVGDNQVFYGVAVLSVYADSFLQGITNRNTNGKRYLISGDGQYLLHPEQKNWESFLGEHVRFNQEFPGVYARFSGLERGVFSFDGKVIGFERIYPHPNHRETFWILIEVMDENVVMQQLDRFVMAFILIFLATVLLVFLATRYFVGGLMGPLIIINRQLRQLSLGQVDKEELDYAGKDEVGQMMQYTGKLVRYLEDLSRQADRISAGNYTESVSILSEQDRLGHAVNNMTLMIRENKRKNEEQSWLDQGTGQLDNLLRGEQSVEGMADKIVTFISNYLQAAVGTFYVSDDEGVLSLYASYAYRNRKNTSNNFKLGEGMVGQAALEKKLIIISEVPERYLRACSSVGECEPACLLIAPFVYNTQVKAVLEIGSFVEFTELQIDFVEQIGERVGIALNTAQSRVRMQEVLQVTRQQAAELQAQQDELQASNEELEEQTQRIRASEEELQANQDQLVATNAELEEKNNSLGQQKKAIEQANEALVNSRKEIERKAAEVARSSKYKSEFLANMSHELRTPLNSLLLLAQTLEVNRQGNLTEDDIEMVKVMHHSGEELLALINDILDLSKVEAGHMTLVLDRIKVSDFFAELNRNFRHQAEQKGLALHCNIADEVPQYISSDRQRLEQILNNLLSNAVKFTDQGEITMSVSLVPLGIDLRRLDLSPENALAVTVQDSGIGIPFAKQQVVFEAFKQADGGTARKYGGTGLGLSIARDLADLLGGEIHLESKEGEGTTFTLYLPVQKENGVVPDCMEKAPIVDMSVEDDRQGLQENDDVVLVIEDDANFAALLVRQCHETGLKCLVALTGEEGLRLASEHSPQAVILDLKLPGISGWKVLEILKEQTATRHIPVHIMSVDDAGLDARRKGALAALQKPVSREQLEHAFDNIKKTSNQQIRTLLVAAQDSERRKNIITLMGNKDVQSEEAGSGQEVLDKLRKRGYDCLIMGIEFPDMSSFSLLKHLKDEEVHVPPVIVYTGKDISWEESAELEQYANSIIIKGVMSEERLLDESSLFLHRIISDLPEKKQRMIRNLHEDDAIFKGKRILLVDDDMRNVFALAKVLGDKGMQTVKAEDGATALAVLEKEDAFDLVLMDIMMPVMDGYEAIKRIRKQPQWKKLPIIALTAKAMKDDRSRCLAAGANDYLTKPVDVERLLALLRLWLYR